MWVSRVEERKMREKVLLRIILNRWKGFADARIDRRQKSILASSHLIKTTCLAVIIGWRRAIEQQQDINYKKFLMKADRAMNTQRFRSNPLSTNLPYRFAKLRASPFSSDKCESNELRQDFFAVSGRLPNYDVVRQRRREGVKRFLSSHHLRSNSTMHREYQLDSSLPLTENAHVPKWIKHELSKRNTFYSSGESLKLNSRRPSFDRCIFSSHNIPAAKAYDTTDKVILQKKTFELCRHVSPRAAEAKQYSRSYTFESK